MTEHAWLECADPQRMLEFLKDRTSDRKLRLFSVACCRAIWHWLLEPEARRAVELSEAFADNPSVSEALAEANKVVEGIGYDEWAKRFGGEPERSSGCYFGIEAVGFASEQPVRPAGVSAYIGLIAGEGGQRHLLQASILRCICNPFQSLIVPPACCTSTVVSLAQAVYDDRAFDRLPILADALEDAGCTHADILNHCRQPGEHVRGCWVVDLVLDKK